MYRFIYKIELRKYLLDPLSCSFEEIDEFHRLTDKFKETVTSGNDKTRTSTILYVSSNDHLDKETFSRELNFLEVIAFDLLLDNSKQHQNSQ